MQFNISHIRLRAALSASTLKSKLDGSRRSRSNTSCSTTSSSVPSLASSAATSRSSSPAPVSRAVEIESIAMPPMPLMSKTTKSFSRPQGPMIFNDGFDPYSTTGPECDDEWSEEDAEMWGEREYFSVLEPRPNRPVWMGFQEVIALSRERC